MKIAILVEGRTEKAFMPHLRGFLSFRLKGNMPNLDLYNYDGRVPKEQKLRRIVENLLSQGKSPADAVIALTDVYTGTRDFIDASDAKEKRKLGSATMTDFIRMRRSMILKLGFCPIGKTFKYSQVTIGLLPPAPLKM